MKKEKSTEKKIIIANDRYEITGPMTYAEFLSLIGSTTKAFTEQVLKGIPEAEKADAQGSLYDAANSCFGKVLDLTFPDVLKPADIDSETLVKAQNQILLDMAKHTDKVVPPSLK